ncbi:SRPBCC family protein [Nocardia transvalensis]|nr:SRPBCC family protein [Nocardia transvalensis]
MRYRVTRSIAAPSHQVWKVISDVEHWPEWTPTMSEIRRLEPGELRLGSKAEIRQPNQPRRVWVVTELENGSSFTWETHGKAFGFYAEHTVHPSHDGTEVVLEFGITGPTAPVVSLLARRKVQAMVDTEADSLKSHCETA